MKPWEETWVYDPVHHEVGTSDGWALSIEEIDEPHGKFMAAAPEMARLLMGMEFTLPETCGDEIMHFECGHCTPPGADERPGHDKHSEDCEWLRIMKKAGIRE